MMLDKPDGMLHCNITSIYIAITDRVFDSDFQMDKAKVYRMIF